MHGVCWDLGSPWLSGRPALCIAVPVLKTLFWGLGLFSVLTSNLMCFFCYFFRLKISCPSHFIPSSFSSSISCPLFHFLLFLDFSPTLPSLPPCFIIPVPCRTAGTSSALASFSWAASLPLLSWMQFYPRTRTRLGRHAGLLTGRKPVITKN